MGYLVRRKETRPRCSHKPHDWKLIAFHVIDRDPIPQTFKSYPRECAQQQECSKCGRIRFTNSEGWI